MSRLLRSRPKHQKQQKPFIHAYIRWSHLLAIDINQIQVKVRQ